jgi:hypothetical protein
MTVPTKYRASAIDKHRHAVRGEPGAERCAAAAAMTTAVKQAGESANRPT